VPHFKQPLLHTPFHARARELSQVDSFVPWAGYTTVDVFTTMEQEYFAIRNATTLYDLTPMVKYRIVGPDALGYLNRLVSRDLVQVEAGPRGLLRVVQRRRPSGRRRHGVSPGEPMSIGCARRTARSIGCWTRPSVSTSRSKKSPSKSRRSRCRGRLPAPCSRMRASWGIELLKPFDIGRFTLAGYPIVVSRTGFTGDLGYELWMAPEAAEAVWDALMAAGRSRGIRAIGSQALNIARLEAGFLSPHVDFVSAEHTIRTGRDRSPLELGLGWLVDFEKGHFNGRRALLAERERGPRRQLVGLDIEGNKPAHNALLYTDAKGNREIGSISSAAGRPLASATSHLLWSMPRTSR
jgi:aminomethyltransferase